MAMHFAKITLVADGTAQRAVAVGTAKSKNVLMYRLYPEVGNTVDAANGPARYGDSTVDWTAASAKGIPLLPGIWVDPPPGGGGAAVYDMTDLWFSGKTGDIFQLIWWML